MTGAKPFMLKTRPPRPKVCRLYAEIEGSRTSLERPTSTPRRRRNRPSPDPYPSDGPGVNYLITRDLVAYPVLTISSCCTIILFRCALDDNHAGTFRLSVSRRSGDAHNTYNELRVYPAEMPKGYP
ncbi:hypothetical protein DFH08DRAFT_799714 [Mycena albidolilacea]|uniref:Uncharacterized protein n=1 Tax=Mycena albidolilacea TaxID=1033008 RepID=A0AAD7AMA6_9AGAR|nr:hypothetical protein DFH08DRAFT_799714 [Mycena albidolilacea]